MAATDDVLIGAPDRSTEAGVVGYAYTFPTSAAAPTSTTEELPSGAEDLGFVNEEGLTIATERTIETIKDWNLDDIRALLTEHSATVTFTLVNWSVPALKAYFGAENVEDDGDEIIVKINARTIADRGWIFNLKDGDRKRRVVIPVGSLSSQGEITLVKSAATPLNIEITPLVDDQGEKIYIYTQKASGGVAGAQSQSMSAQSAQSTPTPLEASKAGASKSA